MYVCRMAEYKLLCSHSVSLHEFISFLWNKRSNTNFQINRFK